MDADAMDVDDADSARNTIHREICACADTVHASGAHQYADDASAGLKILLDDEFGVEIGLRTRLIETVEARLAWAALLKHALENGHAASAVNGRAYRL